MNLSIIQKQSVHKKISEDLNIKHNYKNLTRFVILKYLRDEFVQLKFRYPFGKWSARLNFLGTYLRLNLFLKSHSHIKNYLTLTCLNL